MPRVLKRQLGPCEAGTEVYVGPKLARDEHYREDWGDLVAIQDLGHMYPIAYVHEVGFPDYFEEA